MVGAQEVAAPSLPINAGSLMGAGALKGPVGAPIFDQHRISPARGKVQRLAGSERWRTTDHRSRRWSG